MNITTQNVAFAIGDEAIKSQLAYDITDLNPMLKLFLRQQILNLLRTYWEYIKNFVSHGKQDVWFMVVVKWLS